MSTNIESPGRPSRRLPESAVPEGCPAWGGEKARLWARAQPPVWVPVRMRSLHLLALAMVGLAAGFWLANSREVPPALAALVPLHLVWTLARPEVPRVSGPVLTLVLAWYGGVHDLPVLVGLLLVNAAWALAEFRMSARRTQRMWAVSAAEGVTAVVPDGVGPLRRGRFLVALGLVLAALGGVFVLVASGWDAAADRREAMLAGWLTVGWGLTALASGLLSRRRAAGLRGAPAPVLRVLVRDGANGDVEVFTADDVAAVRPMFTVTAEEWYDDEDEGDEEDEEARLLEEKEMEALLDSLDADTEDAARPGPLREAVLYGAPYDGGELVIVSAPEDTRNGADEARSERQAPQSGGGGGDEEIVVESSMAPVRALSGRAVRLRIAAERARARRAAVYADRRAAAAEGITERLASRTVRRWRAGLLDRAVCLVVVVWAALLVLGEDGGWRYVPGVFLGLVGALLLPRMAAWRITADRDGLWFNGMRGVRHTEWDHLMTVRCEGGELKVDSRRFGFGSAWTAHAPRWGRLERRFGVVLPYERTAAEITAMWRDPALRPTDTSDERARGRALWPLGVALGLVWVAALLLVP
ncbi:hypothetical protein [Streptomyces heilongjiangensis]|uniref:PH domain-containing protein n=1 Tax=Streptomyces heilongjiangensis TaxID=945052 RepID=A0ABW1B1R1_9ACTN|nr:hypothetical protein [Streptomyces heilongjiangensis]MDC2945771.1 hypothetical protein [Streptomyces heilongjiangensis]